MKTKILNFLFLAVLIFFSGSVFAQIPSGYYKDVDGKNKATLKTAFHSSIKSHKDLGYDALWNAFKTTDKKANGKVWDMYSDVPEGTPPYEYTFVTNQCGNYSGEGSCYNREHSFPKSWFNDARPMHNDLFHLYPTDGYVNGRRSNDPFGEVGIASWTSKNGSKSGKSATPGFSGTVFEPIDEYKGDFARAYFYMVTCYEDKVAGFNSAQLNKTKYPAFSSWSEAMLLKWHREDPVSEKEINRNNEIFKLQNNRNPYIDFPELAEYVWGNRIDELFYSDNTIPNPASVTVNPKSLSFSVEGTGKTEEKIVTVKATNLTEDLMVSISDGEVFHLSVTSISKEDAERGYGLLVTYSPTEYGSHSAKLTIGNNDLITDIVVDLTGIASEVEVSETILNAPFATSFDGFTPVSVIGNQVWLHDLVGKYAKITGFVGNTTYENEDWLISPSMDLTDRESATLVFDHTGRMFDALPTMKSDLTLWISSDYNSGLPSTANWTQVEIPNYMSGLDWKFVSSNDINLSALLKNSNARFAFKFVSKEQSGNWEINNVSVKGKTTIVGIGDEFQETNIPLVYTSKGMIIVDLKNIDTEYIEVYNSLGKQVAKQAIVSDINEIAVQAGQFLIVKVGNRSFKVISK